MGIIDEYVYNIYIYTFVYICCFHEITNRHELWSEEWKTWVTKGKILRFWGLSPPQSGSAKPENVWISFRSWPTTESHWHMLIAYHRTYDTYMYIWLYIIIYAVYRSIHSMQLHLLSLDTVYMCLHMRRCWDCKHMQDVRCVWIYIYMN